VLPRCTASLLADGRVLVAGGSPGFGTALASVEVFNARTGRWSPGTPLLGGRYWHTATGLADGGILLVGGEAEGQLVARTEVYSPATDAWLRAGPRGGSRLYHAAALLLDGSVLVAGGDSGESPAAAMRYHPGG